MRQVNTIFIAFVVFIAGFGPAACAEVTGPSATGAPKPPVIDHRGVADIQFGDRRGELEQQHRLTQGPGDCAPRLPDHPHLSPVFDQGQLVLLWVDPPLETPAGVSVGTPVDAARQAHPDAEELRAPPGTYRFDGLLERVGDRAYLFLHDGAEVRKVVVGYAEHARLLSNEGFSTC